jgi:hypothetical protein
VPVRLLPIARARYRFLLAARCHGVTSPAQQIYDQGFAARIFGSRSVRHSCAKISFAADLCSQFVLPIAFSVRLSDLILAAHDLPSHRRGRGRIRFYHRFFSCRSHHFLTEVILHVESMRALIACRVVRVSCFGSLHQSSCLAILDVVHV